MALDLSPYYCAGYFVTRRVGRLPQSSAVLLPERLLSASVEVCAFAPDTWCIAWTGDSRESRIETAAAFSIAEEQLKELTAWVTAALDEGKLGWPNVCFSLDVAQAVARRLLAAASDLVVFGLGLHREFVDEFCRAAEPEQQAGYSVIGRQGVHEAILKRSPLAEGGTPLGFEPLVFNRSLSCSWLCNGLETVVSRQLGIAPNRYGFIGTFDEARQCTQYISRGDVGAEPGLWLPWLIVEYPLRPQQQNQV